MTAIATADAAPAQRSELGRRLGSVIRLHFTNPATLVVIPLIVLASILVLNLGIWLTITIAAGSSEDVADAQKGFSYSGSSAYVFIYMAIVAIQAMSGTFRFAQGFGSTRRDYYLGTSIVFVLLTLGYSAVLIGLGLIEQVTNGWGLGGRMYTPVYFGPTWGDRIIVIVALFLFFFFAGAACATVFVRWRRTGIMVFLAAITLLLILAGLLISATSAWGAVGAWIGANAPTGLALWSLVPTVLFAVIGFFILRRATPAA